MKKSRMPVPAACALLLLLAAPLAAQMDNLTNLSVEWMRMPARNAAADSADIVVYNPAALVRLADGFHLNVGNQSLLRKPRHSYSLVYGLGDRSFGQEGVDAFLPNLYASYKKDKWAVYGGLYISGGGAVADYPDGSFTTDLAALTVMASPVLDESGQPTGYTYGDLYGGTMGHYLKASSYYLTGVLGGAYAISGKLSASAGLRYVRAVNTTKLGLTLADSPLALPDQPLLFDTEDKAGGLGFVLGINYDLNEKLNFAAHYESRVGLDFETGVNRDDFGLAVDGEKHRRDLPAALYLGAGWRWSEKLLMLVDVNYWFQKAADWGPTGLEGYGNWSDVAGDCWAAGVGLEYALSGRLRLSAGTVFTDFLFKDKEVYYLRLGEYEAPKGDNWNCGVGLAYKAAPGLTLNLALGGTFWKKETIIWSGSLPVEVKAHAYSLSIGANLDI
ncbi:MAG TPA: outer membrane protein transport protein [Candidatus Aminicenantes bacterium]|nr:outer membrane protein transport protein [Candidatus Aminicenantes bacterium]